MDKIGKERLTKLEDVYKIRNYEKIKCINIKLYKMGYTIVCRNKGVGIKRDLLSTSDMIVDRNPIGKATYNKLITYGFKFYVRKRIDYKETELYRTVYNIIKDNDEIREQLYKLNKTKTTIEMVCKILSSINVDLIINNLVLIPSDVFYDNLFMSSDKSVPDYIVSKLTNCKFRAFNTLCELTHYIDAKIEVRS